jgi:hypothetical protein
MLTLRERPVNVIDTDEQLEATKLKLQIDQLVHSLFDVSPAEISIIESSYGPPGTAHAVSETGMEFRAQSDLMTQ